MDPHHPVRVAILDDYQNVAPAIFSRLSPRVELQSFPETLNVQDPKQKEALIRRLQDYEVISTMRERTAFPADVITALPRLKLILTTGPANAAIAVKTCTERGIPVAGTTGKSPHSKTPALPPPLLGASLQYTAEQTFALMLGVTRLISHNSYEIANGGWQTGLVTGLGGRTLGLLGLGRIGMMVARIAALGFGMKVLAWSSSLTQEQADQKATQMGLDPGVARITVTRSKADLLRAADVVSLHYVLSDRSRHMIGKEELAVMKSTSVLVNTSRGGLIDEPALLDALKHGRINGVGLDVFTTEPLPADSPWRTTRWGVDGAGYAVLSPHMGYAEESVIRTWYEESVDNLALWMDGKNPGPLLS